MKNVMRLGAERDQFLCDVLNGLKRKPKELPCKYFYDFRGALLFDKICTTNEYYVTRTELAIMHQYCSEIISYLGRRCLLVEMGSGNTKKTQILLKHLEEPAGYVPIDISGAQLQQVAQHLAERFPHIPLFPYEADFTQPMDLSHIEKTTHFKQVIYFPGSTIGNFPPAQALEILKKFERLSNPLDGLLIGIDLKKDKKILTKAYNDEIGWTAAFNLNLLMRINRELHGNFKVEQFEHHAFYNEKVGCVEMNLISLQCQVVTLGEQLFFFHAEEPIHTESSYKYFIEEFKDLSHLTRWRMQKVWTDDRHLFAIFYFSLI